MASQASALPETLRLTAFPPEKKNVVSKFFSLLGLVAAVFVVADVLKGIYGIGQGSTLEQIPAWINSEFIHVAPPHQPSNTSGSALNAP